MIRWAASTPGPVDQLTNTGTQFTAGLGGFLVLFGLALAVWFLGRDLSRRLRRMRQHEALGAHDGTRRRDVEDAETGEGTEQPPPESAQDSEPR